MQINTSEVFRDTAALARIMAIEIREGMQRGEGGPGRTLPTCME